MSWKPIKDAPKQLPDGKDRILLRFGEEGVSLAYWDAYYAEGGAGYSDGFSWIEPFSGDPLNLHFSVPPDGWMPIDILTTENENMVSEMLFTALRTLAQCHTQDDYRAGFSVQHMANTGLWVSDAEYIEAWKIVREFLHLNTTPGSMVD